MPGTPRRRWPICSLAMIALSLALLALALRVAVGPPSVRAASPPAGMASINVACFTPPENFSGPSWGVSGRDGWSRPWHGVSWGSWSLDPAMPMHPIWNPASAPRRFVWATLSRGTLGLAVKTAPTEVSVAYVHWGWLLGLALALGPAPAWRLRRRLRLEGRARRGECLACGYSRESLAPDAPCPECGATL